MGLISGYNLRSMVVRKGTAAMTAMGIAMVVAVFVMTLAIAQGFRATLVASGSPQNAIIMRKGSTSENVSVVLKPQLALIETYPQIARGPEGRPLASPELVVIISLPRLSDGQPANVPVRGRRTAGVRRPREPQFRRGQAADARNARDQRWPAGRRAVRRSGHGQPGEIRRRDLDGRRRVRGRRCLVRVGSVGRRGSDAAGVSAQRISIGHRQAHGRLGVRIACRGAGRRPAALAARAPRAGVLCGAIARR